MGILDIALAVFIGKFAYEVVDSTYYDIRHALKKKFNPKYREMFEHDSECICK